MSESTRVREIYDKEAPAWDQREGVVERVLMGEGMRHDLAEALHGDVLEIGTGTGATYPHLCEGSAVTSLTAVDLSRGMLSRARTRNRLVRVVQMNAEHLAFPDATFDTVTTSLMLCTVTHPDRALREMARVCKPDGTIVLLEHVRASNPVLAGVQRILTPLQERRLGCHLDRQTDRLVRDLGFRIDREDARFFGVFRLIVARPPVAS